MSKQAIYRIRGTLKTVTMAELAHMLAPGERFCTASARDPASARVFLAARETDLNFLERSPTVNIEFCCMLRVVTQSIGIRIWHR